MTQAAESAVLRQHLIDPEICIRCNTCEETCPVDAITHDARNYVVDAGKCNACNECISPCPTGAIDNWRQVDRTKPYTLVEQLGWDTLPPQGEIPAEVAADAEVPAEVAEIRSIATAGQGGDVPPPWSAAHPYVNLYALATPGDRHGDRQLSADRRRRVRRHPAHRARLRRYGFPGARRPDDRDRAARQRRKRTTASRPSLFDREPARRRAAALQQRLAYREARDRGSRWQRGPRRGVELSLRSEEGRRGEGRRALRRVVPHAQPPGLEHSDGLHGNRIGADARDDRASSPAHRAEGGRLR